MTDENRSMHNRLFVPVPRSDRVRSRAHAGPANRRSSADSHAANYGAHGSAD